MKLIIDIDENKFKDIQRIASIQRRRRSLTCEQIIANGKPLQAELEELKAELHETAEMHIDGDYYLRDEWIDEYIDKYIKELNNENVERNDGLY